MSNRIGAARGWFADFYARAALKRLGRETQQPRVYAHSKPYAVAVGLFEMVSGRARAADPKLKQLAVLKTATLAGCPF
ncbi:MAG TPA: hypothetical protein VFJ21_06695 [Mycobacteriales bacterium]|nr:hypothetical protein [Mycobacteriales bacterium]